MPQNLFIRDNSTLQNRQQQPGDFIAYLQDCYITGRSCKMSIL